MISCRTAIFLAWCCVLNIARRAGLRTGQGSEVKLWKHSKFPVPNFGQPVRIRAGFFQGVAICNPLAVRK